MQLNYSKKLCGNCKKVIVSTSYFCASCKRQIELEQAKREKELLELKEKMFSKIGFEVTPLGWRESEPYKDGFGKEYKVKQYHFEIKLSYKGREEVFPYFQGSGIKTDPTLESVVYCLQSDARAGQETFENFCSDFGCDSDSRKAERMWGDCTKIERQLQNLFGSDFESFMEFELEG